MGYAAKLFPVSERADQHRTAATLIGTLLGQITASSWRSPCLPLLPHHHQHPSGLRVRADPDKRHDSMAAVRIASRRS